SFLNSDPSYVFFKADGKPAVGARDIPITQLVSIATHRPDIPTGVVALVGTFRPQSQKAPDASCGDKMTFMGISQDSGGAIGSTHGDIYAGVGPSARKMSDDYNHPGTFTMSVANDAGEAILKSHDCDSVRPQTSTAQK